MKIQNVYTGAALLCMLSVGCAYSESEVGGGGFGGFAPRESMDANNGAGPQAGQLTAGVWDDNLNFNTFSKYVAATSTLTGAPELSMSERAAANTRFSARSPKTQLDIALVLDTTGSMGDEIEYLRSEFRALARSIGQRYPDAEQRWALVAYGDESDDYVVQAHDFVSDLEAFERILTNQPGTSGGDYPEASHRGLNAMNQLRWRAGSVARLAFWVADAPHHAEHADVVAQAFRDAASQDVHIYPVASSGVDELTEHTMRSGAQLTGGRYMFLTDDSGVGGAHKEPTIPCYFVTLLDKAVERMVDIEMSGEHREPSSEDIIRTGGDPENGQCQFDDGIPQFVF